MDFGRALTGRASRVYRGRVVNFGRNSAPRARYRSPKRLLLLSDFARATVTILNADYGGFAEQSRKCDRDKSIDNTRTYEGRATVTLLVGLARTNIFVIIWDNISE